MSRMDYSRAKQRDTLRRREIAAAELSMPRKLPPQPAATEAPTPPTAKQIAYLAGLARKLGIRAADDLRAAQLLAQKLHGCDGPAPWSKWDATRFIKQAKAKVEVGRTRAG